MIHIPTALVLGTNTPHGINVLSDFIEEQTGITPIFHESGWTTSYEYNNGQITDNFIHIHGTGYGYGAYILTNSGNGAGVIYYDNHPSNTAQIYYGDGNGNGYGDGYGNGLGNNTQNYF